MLMEYACPFMDDCDTSCSQAEVGESFRVIVNPRSRQLLSILETYKGKQIPIYLLELLLVNGEKNREDWSTALYHSYLPMLEELGIVEYDRDESVVRYLGCSLIEESIKMVEID